MKINETSITRLFLEIIKITSPFCSSKGIMLKRMGMGMLLRGDMIFFCRLFFLAGEIGESVMVGGLNLLLLPFWG